MSGGSRPQSGAPRTVYGRRQGRPLRSRPKALLETLLPRLAVTLPEPPGRLERAALFPDATGPKADLWLEIGFGGGEHLAWQAARHPDIGFLGAEYFINGVASLLRLVDDHGLANLRLHQGDARDLLAALPDDLLGRVFILFPDPWRKTRHHKRRIVQRETLDSLARVMRGGAELRLATDHRDYLVWMLEHCTAHPAFRWLARGPGDWRRRPDDWPATRYEAKAIDAGREPAYLRFERRARD